MLAVEHLRNYFLLLKYTGDYELAASVGASLAELEKLIYDIQRIKSI